MRMMMVMKTRKVPEAPTVRMMIMMMKTNLDLNIAVKH